ncbi:hypothetical protein J6590_011133 [Homalodisca vitripennis]|nr:hypothetical protein J6590_011133 [Homalodisca vitripennis]
MALTSEFTRSTQHMAGTTMLVRSQHATHGCAKSCCVFVIYHQHKLTTQFKGKCESHYNVTASLMALISEFTHSTQHMAGKILLRVCDLPTPQTDHLTED